ncbi:NAD(P)-binding protein [Auricularia subglabra TFB-10046 SS5]|uniref:NAD(P)-binding protein n=1 Tax=Auricularia subglabra (strain TFB-10046 / SS5) TaxID=717982 RepID=J0D0K6_AURST|nr:NAD(P)-binding protein [Auricularia subglabra TFB-10046 SS5]
MSSSSYKLFVVAGTGPLGSAIATELHKLGATVVFFTRGGSSNTPEGIPSKVVDYSNVDALAEALKGVHVVVSTVSGGGFKTQPILADAAKKAGVKLFVPSEFGARPRNVPDDNILGYKETFLRHLKSLGLPYTIYDTGLFADIPLSVIPSILDLTKKKFTIVGKGETKISLASRPDIGHFVAYSLTHLPPSQLEGAHYNIVGSRLTFREMLAVWEKKYGGPFEVVSRDRDAVLKAVEASGQGEAAELDYVLCLFERGQGNLEDNSSSLIPGWKPETYEEAVDKYYPAAA